MNITGKFRFEIEEASPTRIAGWIHHVDHHQPVELVFKVGSIPVFQITAGAFRSVGDEKEVRPAGFDLALDRTIWKVMNQLSICTPEGDVIKIIDKPAISIRRRDEGEILHELVSANLMEIAGRFYLGGHVDTDHHVKLFSNGRLVAFKMATKEAVGEGESEKKWLGYAFEMQSGRPLLGRFSFIVIDDRFTFAFMPHQTVTMEADKRSLLLPLPVVLEDIVSTKTEGADSADQVSLYNIRHYLGFGAGSVLVFDKASRFKFTIKQEKTPEIVIACNKGDVRISQAEGFER
jgi:hypothetical protein